MKEESGLSIEEIYEQGTPVVRIFDQGLIAVGGSYLHLYSKIYKNLLNYYYLQSKERLYTEIDVKGFSTVGNLLKDWSWREIEEEADEWIKEIEKGE